MNCEEMVERLKRAPGKTIVQALAVRFSEYRKVIQECFSDCEDEDIIKKLVIGVAYGKSTETVLAQISPERCRVYLKKKYGKLFRLVEYVRDKCIVPASELNYYWVIHLRNILEKAGVGGLLVISGKRPEILVAKPRIHRTFLYVLTAPECRDRIVQVIADSVKLRRRPKNSQYLRRAITTFIKNSRLPRELELDIYNELFKKLAIEYQITQ